MDITKGKYLITTDNFFTAPDGRQYNAVWGDCEILGDNILGIKTNRGSSNWFIKVGNPTHHVIVAGCQIHYATSCPSKPWDGDIDRTVDHNLEVRRVKRESYVYIPPEEI